MESCQCYLLLCHIVATTEPVETTLAATTPFGEYIQNQRLICSSMYPSFHNECTPREKCNLPGAPSVNYSEILPQYTVDYVLIYGFNA